MRNHFERTILAPLLLTAPLWSCAMGQTQPVSLSLEALCSRAPIIVVARRCPSQPLLHNEPERVRRPNGEEEQLNYEYVIWPFEVLEALRYRNRGPLGETIGVVRAHADLDHRDLREGLEGVNIHSLRTRYHPSAGLTLETLGFEPVVLFLSGIARDLPAGPAPALNAYFLYAENSLELEARRDQIVRWSSQPPSGPEGPPPTQNGR